MSLDPGLTHYGLIRLACCTSPMRRCLALVLCLAAVSILAKKPPKIPRLLVTRQQKIDNVRAMKARAN